MPSSSAPQRVSPSSPWLTTDDVIDYTQASRQSILAAARRGELQAGRVGRHWRFRLADVDAWLTGQ